MTNAIVTVDGEVKGWDGKLSYSSFSQFHQCKRKFYLRKIACVPPDSDAEVDTHALRFGKALHKLLEDTTHVIQKLDMKQLKAVGKEFELDEDDQAMLLAMYRNYARVRAKTDLYAFACEPEIVTPTFRCFIDVILKEKKGEGWWIGDKKTAASYNQFLNAKLGKDWQLNLYAHHVKEIAEALGLDPKMFKGCRYIVTVKSRMRRKSGESFKTFMLRLEKVCHSYEIPVPKEELDTETTYELFSRTQIEIDALSKMSQKMALKQACPNLNACTNFFKPCEYWSHCHSKTFSELRVREVIGSDI